MIKKLSKHLSDPVTRAFRLVLSAPNHELCPGKYYCSKCKRWALDQSKKMEKIFK